MLLGFTVSNFLPFHHSSGLKWIRIIDVKAERSCFTYCNVDTMRWHVEKTTSELAYFFINSDPSVVSMPYTTWCLRNGWLWGAGGSYKSFLNRTRRVLLLLTTSASVTFYASLVPLVTDVLKDHITFPEVPVMQMASTFITTLTVIHAALSSLLAILFVGVFEGSLRHLPDCGFCRCHRKTEEKEDIYIASSMVVIDIEDDTDDGCKCTFKCCMSYFYLTFIYVFLGCTIITSLGFSTLLLDGTCWSNLWQWLVTVILGILSHALVLDPMKTLLVAIVKKRHRDDMKLY